MEVHQNRRYYNRWKFIKTDDIITGGSSIKTDDIITGGKFIKTDDIITGGSSSKQTIL